MLLHTTYPTSHHPGPHTPPHTSNPWIPTHPCPTLHLNIFKVKGVVGLKIFYPPENFSHQPHATPPMPSHTSLHISLNVCHVTSHNPPPNMTSPPPTPPHSHIPMHPYTYPPMFVMLLHTTHHTLPPMPSHASVHISPMFVMLLHTTYPTPPHPGPHTPPHTSNPQIPTHPCPTLHLNIFKV